MPSTEQSVGSFLMKIFCILLLSLSLLSTQANSEGILQVQIDKADIDIHRDVNQSLSLNCTVSSVDAGPIEFIIWKKDAKLIKATISSENWSVVAIKNLSHSDAGYYKCVAKSKRGKKENGVFVNIKGKPIIFKNGEPLFYTRSPKWISKGGWQPVKLVCYATGSKVINFQWLKDGKEIQPSKLVVVKSTARGYGSILTFIPILKEKDLRYTCQARNEYGMDNFTIGISVKEQLVGDPEITAESHEISSYIGQSNQLVCNGKNVRELDAYTVWLFNGKELTQEQIKNNSRFHSDVVFWSATKSMRMTLTINQTSLEDTGNYTCEVIINQDVYNRTILLTVMSKAKGPSGGREQQRLTSLQLIGLIIGISLSIIAFLILMLSLFKRRKKFKVPEIPQGHFEYGAFITYNSQDFIWVKTNLLPLLESNDINFCIHYRNFEPGVAIQENMVNSVYKSRVVIVVMSNNYMKSKYCRAELDYAVHRALEEHGTNPLVILRIDPAIKKSKLPKEIKNKTFLDVVSNVEKATWEKRLLKYVTWSGNDENENEEVKDEEDLHVALLKRGGEEDFEKNGNIEVKKACVV